jgi:hypothetical protein
MEAQQSSPTSSSSSSSSDKGKLFRQQSGKKYMRLMSRISIFLFV